MIKYKDHLNVTMKHYYICDFDVSVSGKSLYVTIYDDENKTKTNQMIMKR